MRSLFVHFLVLPRRILIGVIKLYQKTLSPDHGPFKRLFPYGYCPHHPTCSMYTIGVLERRGLIIGSALGLWRIIRCNPWTKPSEEKVAETIRKMTDR